jgi:hypothetical protein
MSREGFGPIQGTMQRRGKVKYDVSRGRVTMCNIISNKTELSQGQTEQILMMPKVLNDEGSFSR